MKDQASRSDLEAKPGHGRSGRSETGRRRRRDHPRPPEPLVNLRELGDLIALLNENGLAEFELEREGFRIHLRRGIEYGSSDQTPGEVSSAGAPTPVASTSSDPVAAPTSPMHPGASAESAASEDQGLHIIASPIVGTFYRARSPNAEPFVKAGSQVEDDTVVCIIEAMKLMNEIQAETSGEVAKIYVENGQPVEYGQPLFGIKR
jgi:acetyl-CoA carboxylase biotin carboxyl carrier protein